MTKTVYVVTMEKEFGGTSLEKAFWSRKDAEKFILDPANSLEGKFYEYACYRIVGMEIE